MKTIRHRLFWIGLLAAASIFALLPRSVTQRLYDPTSGQMRDTSMRRVPISLGLDLRGGTHLALEVDESKGPVPDCGDAIRRAERVVRTRIDEFGTTEPVVQVVGQCRLVVELPGVGDPGRAKSIVQRTAFLEFRITDTRNQFRVALPAMDAALQRAGINAPSTVRATGVAELFGSDTVTSEIGAFSAILFEGEVPGEFLVPEDQVNEAERLVARTDVQRLVPRGLQLKWGAEVVVIGATRYRPLYAVESPAIITGEELQSAQAGRDPVTNQAEVRFQLTRRGGQKFAEATARNIGNHLAIILDGRVQGRPPVIRDQIGSSGRIELGRKPLNEANDLALVLRAGALPAPLQIVEERTIGPSLGSDSIRDGVRTSVLAVAFVVLVMSVYYRFSGVLAIAALGLYVVYSLGGLAALGFTLTLPGLAGFALSIGMAVDANVLIFERIREELAGGKSVRLAVDEGFEHAMSAIIDSNVTTAFTALILYVVGTGPVQGFAATLLIGLAASMISAVFVTRTLFLIWLQRRPTLTTIKFVTMRVFAKATYDFIGLRRWAYALSAVLIVPGLVLLAWRGITYSIEFTGGTLIQVETAEPVGTAALRSALDAGGLGAAEIQSFGSVREFVVRARLEGQTGGDAATEATGQAVSRALDEGLGAGSYRIERTEAVGPKVGRELQGKAGIAILVSFVSTLMYLGFRFEWRFGLAAVLATAHDILATVAFIRYLDLEVSLVVVAGILTVLGYSLNDTIVIFDRVRENLRKYRRQGLMDILNLSVNETLPRTILTGGTTLATALVLSFFAGEVIRPFALVMSFGIVVGTFSSIYVASPLLLWIERHWRGEDTRGARVLGPPPRESATA